MAETTKADYQALLNKVSEIQEEYDKQDENKLKQGEYFNIFNIIGKSSDEVNIHSKFLATLLDPKGDHGCGDVFLKAFLKSIRFDYLAYDIKNAEIKSEYDIGTISNEKGKEKGGRIDILITFKCKTKNDEKYAIIIENKIYAGDQKNQLLRYKNFAKDKYVNSYQILYLTLNGDRPSKDSVGDDINMDNKDQFYWSEISYQKDIKKWLRSISKDKLERGNESTGIKQIIKQYISLIDSLTGIGNDSEEAEKIQEIILDDNLQLAIDIEKNICEVKKKIISDFRDFVEDELNNVNKSKYIVDPVDIDDKNYCRIYIYRKEWQFYFTFELYMSSSYECKFGIWYQGKNKKNKEILRGLQDYRNTNSWWMVWDYLNDDYAFWTAKTFLNVHTPEGRKKLFDIIIGKMKNYEEKIMEYNGELI